MVLISTCRQVHAQFCRPQVGAVCQSASAAASMHPMVFFPHATFHSCQSLPATHLQQRAGGLVQHVVGAQDGQHSFRPPARTPHLSRLPQHLQQLCLRKRGW